MDEKILYVEEDSFLREGIALELSAITCTSIEECSSIKCALDVLKDYKNYKFVVTGLDFSDGQGEEIYHYIIENQLHMPVVIIAKDLSRLNNSQVFESFFKDNPGNGALKVVPGKDDLKKIILKAMNPDDKEIDLDRIMFYGDSEYRKVAIDVFLKFEKLSVDIFLQISEQKYIKVISADNEYNKADVQKYIDKGVTHLYVANDDFALLADQLLKGLRDRYRSEAESAINNILDVAIDVQEHVTDKLLSIGVTPASIELMKTSIDSSLELVSSDADIKDIMVKLFKKSDFIAEHSLLLSYIAILMIDQVSDDVEDKKRLSVAAFLHDLILKDSDDLKKFDYDISTLSGLPEATQKFVHSHPLVASQLVGQIDETPSGVAEIIIQHHERPDGSGYPQGLTHESIGLVSSCFILAHHFVELLYSDTLSGDIFSAALEQLKKQYNVGNFKTAYEALAKISS
jgi:HD-GYP domain-containing protein (c-di-GMP phosphodiesterase class II)